MIHVLLSQTDSYRDICDHLLARGARLTVVGPQRDGAIIRSKRAILGAMVSPALLRTRHLWTAGDRLLLVGWQALPVLALIRLGLLPAPARLLVMACFIHGTRARRIVNAAWRRLRFPGLGFIVFSPGEARNLIDEVGIDPGAVHCHLWRQQLDGQADAASIADDGYVFAGGFSNRDYDLLLQACAPLAVPLVVVAASGNQIETAPGARTTILRDLPEAEFELLLAKCRVVAMPLKSQGEACGQSVLLRVLRNGKALIATRHEAIEAYLGPDYQGFVPHGDAQALRAALRRAMDEPAFRATLASQIAAAGARLGERPGPGAEIEQLLLA